MRPPVVASIEFTVSDLDDALSLLVDTMGLTLSFRARHPMLDAQIAEVWAGSLRLNLVWPTDTGDGLPMGDPRPRLSQLDLECPTLEDAVQLRARLVEAGAPVVDQEGMCFVDPSALGHLFGSSTALVLYPARQSGPDDAVATASSPDGAPGART